MSQSSTSGTHAPFAPSGLARVVACAGSYNLIRVARATGMALDEDDTDASREGTAAHWVASEYLQHGAIASVGDLAPNGVAVTDEMIDGAYVYADAVRPYMDGCRIEQHIECMVIHRDCHGTPDFTYGPTMGTLFISDYKFGHRYVSPERNWQLIAYALGTMVAYMPTVRVILQIVQPRAYHRSGQVRTWEIDGDQLRNYGMELSAAVYAAIEPDAVCTAGRHCYECPARHICESALSLEQDALALTGTSIPLDASLTAKAVRLRQVRQAADHLKQMESGLTEDLSAAIRRGENVMGWTLQSSAGREKWTRDATEIVALGTCMGLELGKTAVVTPNQASKAGLPDDIVAAYSERSAGSVSLVEVAAGRLASVFGGGVR